MSSSLCQLILASYVVLPFTICIISKAFASICLKNQRKCLSLHLLHLVLISVTVFCMGCPTTSLTNFLLVFFYIALLCLKLTCVLLNVEFYSLTVSSFNLICFRFKLFTAHNSLKILAILKTKMTYGPKNSNLLPRTFPLKNG